MANFITDLGNAIETALKANADIQAVVDKTTDATTYAIEYGTQRTENPENMAHCFIRSEGKTRVEKFEGSQRSVFTFNVFFQLNDVKGANGRLAQCLQGMDNVFIDSGRVVLDTHLTDNGSNRLGASGKIEVTEEVDPVENIDPDRPVAGFAVEIDITHVMPLV